MATTRSFAIAQGAASVVTFKTGQRTSTLVDPFYPTGRPSGNSLLGPLDAISARRYSSPPLPALIELPVEWILDDYTYYGFDWAIHAYHRIGDRQVYDVYRAEFDQAYQEGSLFLLTMHPFVTVHRSRIAGLDALIGYIKSKPGAWFGTLEQIADASAVQLK